MDSRPLPNDPHALPKGIRIGTVEDEALFETLWTEFLETELFVGGDQRPDAKTLTFYRTKFNEYASGKSEGLTLFGAHDNSFLFWGSLGGDLPWSHGLGKWIPALGIYVRPKFRRQGWATRMRLVAKDYFKARGYDSSLHGNWPGNKLGYETLLQIGAKPYQNTLVLRF